MDSKSLIIFFIFAVLGCAEKKEKRGLLDLVDYNSDPWFAFPSFDSKEFSFFPPGKEIPNPLNKAFKIPDPEAYGFEQPSLWVTQPYAFPQSLSFKQEFQLLGLSEPHKSVTFSGTDQQKTSTSIKYFNSDINGAIKPIVEQSQE